MKLLRHMWHATFLAAVLVLQALTPNIASAQTIKVLWYTSEPDGSVYRTKMQELASSAHTYAAGSGLTWELTFFGPADSPDFTAYDALVTQTWDFPSTNYSGLFNNKAAITSARGSRTFVTGQDADWHYINYPGAVDDGPRGFLVNAVNWAASGTGLGIVALDDIGAWWTDSNSFLHDELVGHVQQSGTNSVIIPAATASFPVNAGLTSAGLSNWSTSAHTRISKSLPGYLAINDYGPDPTNWSVTVVTESEAGGGTNPAEQLSCQGFLAPFDEPLILKAKNNRVIPLKIVLRDEAGDLVTADDLTAPPVVDVEYLGGSASGTVAAAGELLAVAAADYDNHFRYDITSGVWINNFPTHDKTTPGDYAVMAIAGDDSYEIDGCVQTFGRQ